MKRLLLITAILFIWNILLIGQEGIKVEGAILIGNCDNPIPEGGTIRWTGSDFEGWNGTEWLSLTGCCDESPIVDGCGNTYESITIGTQEWLTTDLRTTKCNDGTPIPLVEGDDEWAGLNTTAYCWYDNNEIAQTEDGYGALYNWYAVNTCNICPTGWHVPTDEEWTILINFLGGSSVAGGKMKEEGLVHWVDPNNATNESGWTGLPGGLRSSSGTFGTLGNNGWWWSSTNSGEDVWLRNLDNVSAVAFDYDGSYKSYGFSVRCIKD